MEVNAKTFGWHNNVIHSKGTMSYDILINNPNHCFALNGPSCSNRFEF
jgi:hypothetical protein